TGVFYRPGLARKGLLWMHDRRDARACASARKLRIDESVPQEDGSMRNDGREPDWRLDMVTATEIARSVYCHKQWRLRYGIALDPANPQDLDPGTFNASISHVQGSEGPAGTGIEIGQGRSDREPTLLAA